ncbi:GGDEF domain-containing protein [soil metagenome]
MTLNFQSIKFRIIALGVTLIIISVLVRQLIALPLFQESVGELVETQQLALATYVARDVDRDILSRLALIDRFATELSPEFLKQPEKLQAWIKDRQRANPMFNGGLLALQPDGHGRLAQYPAAFDDSKRDDLASDWFSAALHGSKAVMGKPSGGYGSSDPAIVFAVPVRDTSGRVVTVLAGVALLNKQGFLDGMQETQLGASGGFLLISPEDHVFVASSDPGMMLKPTPSPGVDQLHDRAMAGYRGTGISINAAGIEELSAIASVPSAGWFVVAHLPTAEAFRPIQTMRSFMFKAGAISLIGILAILLMGLTRILRPLTDAARAIRDMADSKSELIRLPVMRNDEVGKLLKGFNFLVDKLQEEETARAASEARLKFMAHHDSLTGLYNRAILEERLEQALARAERNSSKIALLFCDMDGFKAINDQYGHLSGDAVLCQVASRLSEGRRRIDTVARLGGDEFVILLTDLDDVHAAAIIVARQCLEAISLPFEVDGKTLKLGMSIGIAAHAGSAVTPSYLIAQADVAMYRAKRKGKGDFFFMDEASSFDS